ncbi:nucleoside 2-deoxyribosyltransferase [Thiocapsa marina]|uniref:Nucleoside 2-deoxyribosyltransferase n=1 Tax=Thiocapsa marina 5811 TaxID=768671 RepID=F9UA33_9GAMM|nr:nucleoside 2-deoxyribosyltransferase [Thiocapsa marina]EGV18981.1 nucleoside 2-deoxyribosyltransferase [Thiocapsa marina 5811]
MRVIYLAGPLFTEAERDWHRKTKHRLLEQASRRGEPVEIIWPYELITPEEIAALGAEARAEIFLRCKVGLDRAHVLIALLDGTQVDDGTAWEIGYFFATKAADAKIVGIRTDFRRAGESEHAIVNAMVEMACDVIVNTQAEMHAAVLGSDPVLDIGAEVGESAAIGRA